jgi:hypothetical protein
MGDRNDDTNFVDSAAEGAEGIDDNRRALMGLAASSLAGALFGLPPIGAARAQPAPNAAAIAPWWPSKWGKDDQIGATNLVTPAKILDALRLVKTGKVYEMSHLYESSMPGLASVALHCAFPGLRPVDRSEPIT